MPLRTSGSGWAPAYRKYYSGSASPSPKAFLAFLDDDVLYWRFRIVYFSVEMLQISRGLLQIF